jgi:hypothetical protein
LHTGASSLEKPLATPLSSHTRISPNQTAYEESKDRQSAALLDALSKREGKKSCGDKKSSIALQTIKSRVKRIFIPLLYALFYLQNAL